MTKTENECIVDIDRQTCLFVNVVNVVPATGKLTAVTTFTISAAATVHVAAVEVH